MSHNGIKLINICDHELLGKVVKGGGLEMSITEEYYGNELIEVEEVLEMVKTASIVSLAGKRIVEKVIKAKLAAEAAVRVVGDVPFLMIFKFQG